MHLLYAVQVWCLGILKRYHSRSRPNAHRETTRADENLRRQLFIGKLFKTPSALLWILCWEPHALLTRSSLLCWELKEGVGAAPHQEEESRCYFPGLMIFSELSVPSHYCNCWCFGWLGSHLLLRCQKPFAEDSGRRPSLHILWRKKSRVVSLTQFLLEMWEWVGLTFPWRSGREGSGEPRAHPSQPSHSPGEAVPGFRFWVLFCFVLNLFDVIFLTSVLGFQCSASPLPLLYSAFWSSCGATASALYSPPSSLPHGPVWFVSTSWYHRLF